MKRCKHLEGAMLVGDSSGVCQTCQIAELKEQVEKLSSYPRPLELEVKLAKKEEEIFTLKRDIERKNLALEKISKFRVYPDIDRSNENYPSEEAKIAIEVLK